VTEAHDKQWHLDKRVPVALIIVIFIQTVSIVWWAATLSARVGYLEDANTSRQTYEARIITLEVTVRTAISTLDRIETTLNKRYGSLHRKNETVIRPQ